MTPGLLPLGNFLCRVCTNRDVGIFKMCKRGRYPFVELLEDEQRVGWLTKRCARVNMP